MKRSFVTMVAIVGTLALSSAATAISIDLTWLGSGTTVTGTSLTSSAVVTLHVETTFGVPPGLNGVTVSVKWDSDALSLVSCDATNKSTVAGGSFSPLLGSRSACQPASPGLQPAMDQQAGWLPYLPGPGTLSIATLVFHVVGMSNNGVVQSFMKVGDGWGDNNYVFSMNAAFGSATVNIIPEPTTAVLVGVGFLGLLAAGRRGRKRS